ncbi:hypothetical protein K6119_14085 [Paracrocinitomix mangrovi]|uniref:hypothetical protein n=1 Tax=Paracrocinitomix mangrovi TaxID=2862509 RepID=UPI001C8D5194|nr:hypothetical protein [Paracrocinitomix mangrovi]UKN00860.1 hypothetical protein K6119_14085 [Paracrocinitomix mangrovi]
MDSKQNLYYALGIFSYAVAKADGIVQYEEREALHKIVKEGISHDMDFQYVEIIFNILQKDKVGFEDVHKWALEALEQGKYHLTEKIKEEFIQTMKKVAEAFPPKSDEEHELINQFIQEIRDFKVNMTID